MQARTHNNNSLADETDDILRLRELLLGAEYQDLLALKKCLNDPEAFSHKISSIISESISQRLKVDQSLPEALAPTISIAIQESISKDPQALADSLYPVMGPAIRKSISETLAQMLENINQLLEQSLTPKSLGWRFDAWRSGKSYAEVVLSNTLEYQVEQVFMIHSETGLLIQHVVADMAITKDPDMVSSMLSAIQSYIQDSFAVDETETLHSMSLGDLTVVIEKGPSAILAAVVRGKIPRELATAFKECLETIHTQYGQQLLSYSGDSDDFIEAEPLLRNCLLFRRKDKEYSAKRKFPWLAVIFILIIGAVGAFFFYQKTQLESWRSNALINLNNEPGIVVINSSVDANKVLVINGLRDPLSASPVEVAQKNLNNELNMAFNFVPYLSIEPEILMLRATAILQPPRGVDIDFEGATILLSGNAELQWLQSVESKWASIHGVDGIDYKNLTSYDPVMQEITSLLNLIEGKVIYFDKGEIEPIEAEFEDVANAILRLNELSSINGDEIIVRVFGGTDQSGADELNFRIALERANQVSSQLLAFQIPSSLIEIHASPVNLDRNNEAEERRVFFKIEGLP